MSLPTVNVSGFVARGRIAPLLSNDWPDDQADDWAARPRSDGGLCRPLQRGSQTRARRDAELRKNTVQVIAHRPMGTDTAARRFPCLRAHGPRGPRFEAPVASAHPACAPHGDGWPRPPRVAPAVPDHSRARHPAHRRCRARSEVARGHPSSGAGGATIRHTRERCARAETASSARRCPEHPERISPPDPVRQGGPCCRKGSSGPTARPWAPSAAPPPRPPRQQCRPGCMTLRPRRSPQGSKSASLC